MSQERRVRQIHIRVTPELKKALKVFCAREGVTEQSWLRGVIEAEMSKQAADLWPPTRSDAKPERVRSKKAGTERPE